MSAAAFFDLKPRWPVAVLLALALAACATPVDGRLSEIGAPPSIDPPAAAADPAAPLSTSRSAEAIHLPELARPPLSSSEGVRAGAAPAATANGRPGPRGNGILYVGSFNIQNFGKTKAAKPDIMMRLAEIVRRHDVIAIQEVSDKSETATAKLLEYVNRNGSTFAYALSPRSGVQTNDIPSQEQYAVFYDTKTVKLVKDLGLFDDGAADVFQREPQVVQFTTVRGEYDFVLINIHTRPESAVSEIGGLQKVATWTNMKLGRKPLIILGDFNGSCSYAKPAQLDALPIRGANFTWVVPDSADTNLSAKACAYDRIVLTDASKFDGRWDVWKAFQSKAISDHWPIWAAFRIDQ